AVVLVEPSEQGQGGGGVGEGLPRVGVGAGERDGRRLPSRDGLIGDRRERRGGVRHGDQEAAVGALLPVADGGDDDEDAAGGGIGVDGELVAGDRERDGRGGGLGVPEYRGVVVGGGAEAGDLDAGEAGGGGPLVLVEVAVGQEVEPVAAVGRVDVGAGGGGC